MNTVVPADLDGERLDLIVARLGGVSRALARALVEQGSVAVDGETVAAVNRRMVAGSAIAFELPDAIDSLVPEEVPFEVLHEDRFLAVVSKPAGVVTHPGAGRTGATLVAGILHRWPSVRGVGDEGRWGIVHRLDRDTSGVLVVALTVEAFGPLRTMIRQRRVERRYLALVKGTPPMPTGTIDAPIAADRHRRGRRRVDPTGRSARTHYRSVVSGGGVTLLDVTLETGRTHQIRVHLTTAGLPIIGDRQYGIGSGAPRQFLHAARVRFEHPITQERLDIVAPLPGDLRQVLADYGLEYRPG
ncbi:MAG TPA: RluA family pseudouridine synthase [Acidimicrobiia bacterium]|nr:RluA family pseudouridine synthase [Acidimicrobiia bacterium]